VGADVFKSGVRENRKREDYRRKGVLKSRPSNTYTHTHTHTHTQTHTHTNTHTHTLTHTHAHTHTPQNTHPHSAIHTGVTSSAAAWVLGPPGV